VTISAPGNTFTLVWAPERTASVRQTLERYARNKVKHVTIDYRVDRSSNTVTVSHRYLDDDNAPVETMAGLMPLQWKRAPAMDYTTSVRSARGLIKFAPMTGFDYVLPSIGVLPALPVIEDSLNEAELRGLVEDFVAGGTGYWNTANDTYWNGKAVGRLSEVLAIADQLGMVDEATDLRDWLKGELADWMSAERDGTLDSQNYFVYDSNWSTLLGMEESFASHQQLNDHHFHYGYFVRAAAEVCRVDKAFCSDEQYGQMFELLIRDYAGGKNDPMFPYLRTFDPANGFSWASGQANFVRGNNNESTSEAANAYGAMVLYGLVTGNDDIMERGLYLHASTSATYWEYWNDIDGYLDSDPDARNFPPGYPRITTSIIWGDGSAFATWFSPAFAHILGIQGLPSNPLIMHVGLFADYLDDYVALGLEESANGKPSGLPSGHWTDLWWNLWSMTDADAAIADYEATISYEPEAGEARAHTYHWIYTMRALGELQTGTGALTADYPAAMAFETDAGVTSYVVYNYSDEAITVTFSDGTVVEAAANAFAIEQR
jgi:endo-1,3(4)-beta-glucanase